MCFALLPKALRHLHPNLSKFKFSSFLTFFQKIFNLMIQIWRGVLRDGFLVFGMCLETSYIFHNFSSRLLLRSLYYPLLFLKIVKKWNFTFGLHRRGVLRDEFLRSEKFFHRKVWNLENIFHICITSSYLP